MIGNLDPKKVTITVGSKYLTGYASDGIFNLAWNADRVSLVVGSQGDGTYVEGADNSAILVVTLSPTSPSVKHLTDLCENRTRFDTTINDASEDGQLTYFGSDCRVQKFSDIARNTAAPTNSFAIIIPDVQRVA